MRTDLRLNYNDLDDVSNRISAYRDALAEMDNALKRLEPKCSILINLLRGQLKVLKILKKTLIYPKMLKNFFKENYEKRKTV